MVEVQKRQPMRIKKLTILLLLLTAGFLFFTFSCSLNEAKKPVYNTAETTVAISEDERYSAMVTIGTFSDAVRVTMEVKGEDKYGVYRDPLVPESDLVKGAGGVWEGTITGLPVGPVLTFTARGYDADGVEIFSGVSTKVLSGVNDMMIVAMGPVDDGVAVMFPRVWSISLPAEIVSGTAAEVSVRVEGNADESMSYAFSSSGGVYEPASGNISLPSSGTGTINALYTAPTEAGTYGQTLKVVNSQGNSVEIGFFIRTVYGLTDAGVGVLFAPVVVSLNGKRQGDTVTWTATVDDDKQLSDISFNWDFNGTASAWIADSAANPAELKGYDDGVAGAVKLTVTDGDGLTSRIIFVIVPGQYPDEVVIYN